MPISSIQEWLVKQPSLGDIHLRQIQANLPAIGAFKVNLYTESEKLVNFFGDEELARLGRINHLGAASVAFSGINHTRLEYVLIQCAIAQMVSKLYKDNADLALANTVELDGLSSEISSGEELLKCWAIIGNIGHPNWTFTTERALLDGALKDNDLRKWLISGAIEKDLKTWAKRVVDNYEIFRARYVLALLRLREERPSDPRKKLFRQIVRNKVLPLGGLLGGSPAAREKLGRLRFLSRNIQLLSMVTLDAYHSHSPIRLEILPAIQELAESATQTSRLKRFFKVLESTAGWLAEEVYLHPKAVAAQRSYEIKASQKALKRFRRLGSSIDARNQFLNSVMADGFGRPKTGDYEPLVRLSFPLFTTRMLSGGHRNSRVELLTKEIGVSTNSIVCVDDNNFSNITFIDVLYRPNQLTAAQFGLTYRKLVLWLLKSIEADSLESIRRFLSPTRRSGEGAEETRIRILRNRLTRSETHLSRIIVSIIENVIPEGWSASIDTPSPDSHKYHIGWKLIDSRGVPFDEMTKKLEQHQKEAIAWGNNARFHELCALEEVVKTSDGALVAAMLLPIILRNPHGHKKDEWDGVVFEITETQTNLIIVEAKGGASKAKRANLAFKQLEDTRRILRSRYQFKTKRARLPRLGASLQVYLQ